MKRPSLVAIAIVVAVLVGANLAQAIDTLAAYWWSSQYPTSSLFQGVLYFIWLPLAVGSMVCGVLGAFHLALGRARAEPLLLVFVWAYTLFLKVDGYDLGWSVMRLAITFGSEHLALGINFVGVGMLFWAFWMDPASDLLPDPIDPPSPTS